MGQGKSRGTGQTSSEEEREASTRLGRGNDLCIASRRGGSRLAQT